MTPKATDQFFNTVKDVFQILCPGVEYNQGKGFNNQPILTVEDKEEGVSYLFKFNYKQNDIFFRMEVSVGDEKKKKEITWRVGSTSVVNIVDQIRREKNCIKTGQGNPFSVLNKLKK